MKFLTVYCGARDDVNHAFKDAAYALGSIMAERELGLVYGGGGRGLMGAVANGVLDNNGQVIGIIPERLKNLEMAKSNVSQLITTANMSERKVLMEERADGFLALPGGIGTMDELFQVMADWQLGYHKKPIGILNTLGYYDSLIGLLNQFVAEGFAPQSGIDALLIDFEPKSLIDRVESALAE